MKLHSTSKTTPSVFLGHTHGPLPFLKTRVVLSGLEYKKHIHILGTTGVGKSKLNAHIAVSQILDGTACSIVDPHADLTYDVLSMLLDNGYFQRPDALDKLWYIEFANPDYFVPFNILKQSYPIQTTVRNILEAFKRTWPSLAGGAAPADPHGHELAKVTMLDAVFRDAQTGAATRDLCSNLFVTNGGRNRVVQALGMLRDGCHLLPSAYPGLVRRVRQAHILIAVRFRDAHDRGHEAFAIRKNARDLQVLVQQKRLPLNLPALRFEATCLPLRLQFLFLPLHRDMVGTEPGVELMQVVQNGQAQTAQTHNQQPERDRGKQIAHGVEQCPCRQQAEQQQPQADIGLIAHLISSS